MKDTSLSVGSIMQYLRDNKYILNNGFTMVVNKEVILSLIHISEPTRPY